MTTARDAKRLVRPLLERHDDLSMVGAFLIVPPVRHFIRAVLIGRLGSREWFRPVAASNFLFECQFNFTFHHDDYLHPKSKEMRWRLDTPGVGAALCEVIEDVALPKLRRQETLEEFRSRYGVNGGFFEFRKFTLDAACGDFESADRLSGIVLNLPMREPHWRRYREEHERIVSSLCPLVAARDRAGIAALLNAWEAATVKALKLEHLWEPSPFPVESAGV